MNRTLNIKEFGILKMAENIKQRENCLIVWQIEGTCQWLNFKTHFMHTIHVHTYIVNLLMLMYSLIERRKNLYLSTHLKGF